MPNSYIQAQLKGIVGIRLPIARIEGKLKMGQRGSVEDRLGVAKGLAESDRPGDQAVAPLIPTLLR